MTGQEGVFFGVCVSFNVSNVEDYNMVKLLLPVALVFLALAPQPSLAQDAYSFQVIVKNQSQGPVRIVRVCDERRQSADLAAGEDKTINDSSNSDTVFMVYQSNRRLAGRPTPFDAVMNEGITIIISANGSVSFNLRRRR